MPTPTPSHVNHSKLHAQPGPQKLVAEAQQINDPAPIPRAFQSRADVIGAGFGGLVDGADRRTH